MQVICVGPMIDIKEFTRFVNKWFGKDYPMMYADIALYGQNSTDEMNAYVLDNLGVARKRNVKLLLMNGTLYVKKMLIDLNLPFIDIFIKPEKEEFNKEVKWGQEPHDYIRHNHLKHLAKEKCWEDYVYYCNISSKQKPIVKIPTEMNEPLENYFNVVKGEFTKQRMELDVCEIVMGIEHNNDLTIFNEVATAAIKAARTCQKENGLGDKSKILFEILKCVSLKLEYLVKK